MIAVSAREEDPPRRPALPAPKTGKKNQPLHWMLLTTEGQADLDTACTVLHWYELRWRIERFFHALKVGTRIEDRRLDEADDLRSCLAFDAITAFRVRDPGFLGGTYEGTGNVRDLPEIGHPERSANSMYSSENRSLSSARLADGF
ncbi:MAG: transposase [Rhodobacteraceae bacterium]|nr:transposase [Paracoccaceae bacterium]